VIASKVYGYFIPPGKIILPRGRACDAFPGGTRRRRIAPYGTYFHFLPPVYGISLPQ